MRLALISLLLVSCFSGPRVRYLREPPTTPTPEGFTEMMKTWEDADSEHLLKSWGVPNSTFSTGSGTEVWVYDWDRSYRTPVQLVTTTTGGSATSTIDLNTFGGSTKGKVETTYQPTTSTTRSYGGDLVKIYCKVQMYTKDGRVDYWKFDGNDCTKVPSPKPVDCLQYGGQFHIQEIGRYKRGLPFGSAVKLSNGQVFRLSEKRGIERAAQWKPLEGKGKPVLVCRDSGIGQYLLTYPSIMGPYVRSKVYVLKGNFLR